MICVLRHSFTWSFIKHGSFNYSLVVYRSQRSMFLANATPFYDVFSPWESKIVRLQGRYKQ